MPVTVAFIKELEKVDPQLRGVLIALLEEMERQRERWEESVTRTEFNELKEIVRDLGRSVAELAEAQRRTEARLDRLEQIVAELAEAQKRTEARLEELAEAQKRTEEELSKLTCRVAACEERLEGLSNSVGYSLENAAYVALPRLLKERFGLEVRGRLARRYFSLGKKDIQVNIYGDGVREGREVLILGECKVRPSRREVLRFEKYARRIAEAEGKEPFLVFVAHDFPPKMEAFLAERGLAYFWSYEF